MNNSLDYPYLLAVHTLCVDGQLHQNELRFLQSLGQNISVDPNTSTEASLILAQDDSRLSLEAVLQQITPDQYPRALSLVALAAHYDGVFDRAEKKLIDRLKQQWKISNDLFSSTLEQARIDAQRLIADVKISSSSKVSTGAKVLSSLESVLGKTLIDQVVCNLGTVSMKARIQDFRIEALLAGVNYDNAIDECRKVGLIDIGVTDKCMHATAVAMQEISVQLNNKITEMTARIGDHPAQAAREALSAMKADRSEIDRVINQELQGLKELQDKKRRAMNFYTIAFMGRSKAGKSTLHAVVTGGGWDQIGVGRQNTTRLNRVYEWHKIRVIDTPGIATPGGEELGKVAESIIDEADIICFVVTNNNQQTSEFKFLEQLRKKGKPLLVLLNVKEDLSNPVRLKRFLDRPDQAFSDEKDRLGGHIDRIRRDAAEYYGTSNFPIIPVQLLAAQIAQQNPDNEHAQSLIKASRMQHFLDSLRLSLLQEGRLRRSQNLLGSTVADIERPCNYMKTQSDFYLNFSKTLFEQTKESKLRLEKARDIHSLELEQALRDLFAELQQAVPNFAEDHWDDSETSLNSAWLDELHRFSFEERINLAQETAAKNFSEDMQELLTEVNQEIHLQRKLSFSSKKLNEQDSSVWFQKTLLWGSGIVSLGIAVLALANIWNPGGWVMAGVAFIGVIASFFESKASKRRKAVTKISSALQEQIEAQEKQIIEAAVKHFKEQCLAGAAAVQDYLKQSEEGLSFVGQILKHGADTLQKQRDILNIHFAARILDFASSKPSESSAKELREGVLSVRRKVGQSIDIKLSTKVSVPKKLNIIESVIQEKITIEKAGA